jgi:hypothetical protein
MDKQTETHTSHAITLRVARQEDTESLARLAELDSARSPARPVLLAEVGGELGAALSLSDGAVIADPFRPTARLVYLLRARAKQLRPMREVERSARARTRSRLRLAAATG